MSSLNCGPAPAGPGVPGCGAKIVGVVGGSVGHDPYDLKTWSGVSHFLFQGLQTRGSLSRAFGARVGPLVQYPLMARNFSWNRATWRAQYYFDPAYRRQLTKAVASQIRQDDYHASFLQIGAMFDLPSVVRGRSACVSYHDGNLVELERSGYLPKGVSSKRVNEAFEFEKHVHHSTDRILTFSEPLRRSFVTHYGVPDWRVVTVGAGVNLDDVPHYVPDKRYDTQELLFVGADFARKGGPTLLKAFRAVLHSYPKAILHIAGPRELVIPQDLQKSVQFHGFLSKSDPVSAGRLLQLFRQSSLFVLPSRYEPFGIAALEAMLHQVPCIVTGLGGLVDAVRPHQTGFIVERDNVEDLTAKICMCLRDPELLRRMGDSGRALVLERFTWDKVAERIHGAVDSVRAGDASPGTAPLALSKGAGAG